MNRGVQFTMSKCDPAVLDELRRRLEEMHAEFTLSEISQKGVAILRVSGPDWIVDHMRMSGELGLIEVTRQSHYRRFRHWLTDIPQWLEIWASVVFGLAVSGLAADIVGDDSLAWVLHGLANWLFIPWFAAWLLWPRRWTK